MQRCFWAKWSVVASVCRRKTRHIPLRSIARCRLVQVTVEAERSNDVSALSLGTIMAQYLPAGVFTVYIHSPAMTLHFVFSQWTEGMFPQQSECRFPITVCVCKHTTDARSPSAFIRLTFLMSRMCLFLCSCSQRVPTSLSS